MSKFSNYQVFVAVAEEQSIAQAASRLHLSAPAVSKQLAQFEAGLQVQLFHRSHKRLDITDAGRAFLPRCKAILASISQAEEALLSDSESICGTLSITLSKALCRSCIFDILSDFEREHPGISFDIHFSDQLEDLHDKGIDFAFRLGESGDNSHMLATSLIDTQLVACATPQYLERHGIPERFAELGDAKLVLMSPLHASEALRKFLNREKVRFAEAALHKANDIEGVYQLVRAGMGIGILLDISVQRELDEGVFVPVLSQRKLPRKRLYLLSRKTQWQSAKLRAFKAHVKASFAGL